MSKTDYAVALFGSVLAVKRLYVVELERRLGESGLAPADLDAIIGKSAEWPATAEILADPSLFTLEFHQALEWAGVGEHPAADRVPCLVGEGLLPRVREYVSDRSRRDRAIAEFQSEARIVHVSIEPPEVEAEKIMSGEPLRQGSPNHIPPDDLAIDHILSSILHRMGNIV